MSPEYAMFGQFSEKSDVFSFGIIILEIITGKKNVHSYESHHMEEGLATHVSFSNSSHAKLYSHMLYFIKFLLIFLFSFLSIRLTLQLF